MEKKEEWGDIDVPNEEQKIEIELEEEEEVETKPQEKEEKKEIEEGSFDSSILLFSHLNPTEGCNVDVESHKK